MPKTSLVESVSVCNMCLWGVSSFPLFSFLGAFVARSNQNPRMFFRWPTPARSAAPQPPQATTPECPPMAVTDHPLSPWRTCRSGPASLQVIPAHGVVVSHHPILCDESALPTVIQPKKTKVCVCVCLCGRAPFAMILSRLVCLCVYPPHQALGPPSFSHANLPPPKFRLRLICDLGILGPSFSCFLAYFCA